MLYTTKQQSAASNTYENCTGKETDFNIEFSDDSDPDSDNE